MWLGWRMPFSEAWTTKLADIVELVFVIDNLAANSGGDALFTFLVILLNSAKIFRFKHTCFDCRY